MRQKIWILRDNNLYMVVHAIALITVLTLAGLDSNRAAPANEAEASQAQAES